MGQRSTGKRGDPKSTPHAPSLLARIIARERELETAITECRERARHIILEAQRQAAGISSAARKEAEEEAGAFLRLAREEATAEASSLMRQGERDGETILKEGRARLPAVLDQLLHIVLPSGKGDEGP